MDISSIFFEKSIKITIPYSIINIKMVNKLDYKKDKTNSFLSL